MAYAKRRCRMQKAVACAPRTPSAQDALQRPVASLDSDSSTSTHKRYASTCSGLDVRDLKYTSLKDVSFHHNSSDSEFAVLKRSGHVYLDSILDSIRRLVIELANTVGLSPIAKTRLVQVLLLFQHTHLSEGNPDPRRYARYAKGLNHRRLEAICLDKKRSTLHRVRKNHPNGDVSVRVVWTTCALGPRNGDLEATKQEDQRIVVMRCSKRTSRFAKAKAAVLARRTCRLHVRVTGEEVCDIGTLRVEVRPLEKQVDKLDTKTQRVIVGSADSMTNQENLQEHKAL
ncbi:hypothetical protein EIP91_006353 [Steccherinum ochraceum]|uniref:Uncharacterized protein n=1 Tax=Steccherinum ochraceum TaxID=92696 RepID=A0A4R0R5T0_9APHY|nr:hypothetical protein EIP91_006353 [Steccherinum ochraceum]